MNRDQQIRFLVENYYDMQKLRVESFNRIVAYVKSHEILETQMTGASQPILEIRERDASHLRLETQNENASQIEAETQLAGADKPSTLAHQIVTSKTEVPKDISELVWYHNSLHETEKQLAKRLDAWSSHHPLRAIYLSKIYGIGPILSSGILSWLTPIERFQTISKLWKYCGLAPDQKRRKGEKLSYNPRLKTLMWKIATSFEKQNKKKSHYTHIYEQQKAYYTSREDFKQKITAKEKGVKGHIRNMTLRYVVKRFLADLWVTWRKLEGLETSQPYIIGKEGHSHYEPPTIDKPIEAKA